jgi:four helix bundle protein
MPPGRKRRPRRGDDCRTMRRWLHCVGPASDPLPLPMPLPLSGGVAECATRVGQASRFLVTADSLAEKVPAGRACLADQMHLASLSIVLDLTEGARELRPSEKARFYRMALRSATECAAIIDASTALGVAGAPTAALVRPQPFTTVRMLSRMVQNLKTCAARKIRRNQPWLAAPLPEHRESEGAGERATVRHPGDAMHPMAPGSP